MQRIRDYQSRITLLLVSVLLLTGSHTVKAQQNPVLSIENKNKEDAVNQVIFSPDGTKLLTGGLYQPVLWKAKTGERIGRLRETGWHGSVTGVAFSPDGKLAATGYAGYYAKVWDVASRRLVRTVQNPEAPPLPRGLAHRGGMTVVAFSPDGRTLLVGDSEGGLVSWDVATGEQIARHTIPVGQPPMYQFGWFRSLAFLPNGRQVLAVCETDTMLLDLNETLRNRMDDALYRIDGRGLSLSRDCGRALIRTTVMVIDVQTGEVIRDFNFGRTPKAAALSPDGKIAVIGGSGPEHPRLVVNVDTGEVLRSYPVTSNEDDHPASRDDIIAFAPDGRRFVTVNGDELHGLHALHFWDISDLVTAVEDAALYDQKE